MEVQISLKSRSRSPFRRPLILNKADEKRATTLFANESNVPALPGRKAAPLTASGKWFMSAGEKWLLRGVTYGTFKPNEDGQLYPSLERADEDLRLMAESGVNCLRTYTPPPRWFLDLAWQHGIRVCAGVTGERFVPSLADGRPLREIASEFVEEIADCLNHPALAAVLLGNEIPAPMVRWLGGRKVEQFLYTLYRASKEINPNLPVSYVNYPTTEYLHLPFLDFVSFNVYLESEPAFKAYVRRLQHLAGERPLVIAEFGLDSLRKGENEQACLIESQIEAVFADGCAGAFVYAWTDEWYRGGQEVLDWNFGLTDRNRAPKPALAAVSRGFSRLPLPVKADLPHITVAVCTYNGSRTLHECLTGVGKIEYPHYDVVVVDDGSTDNSAAIASQFPVKLIRTENRGLSSARNTALQAASGQVIAYIDDDAYPDAHWLTYLAETFAKGDVAAVGGPNIPPADDAFIAQCVAHAPGGPTHVMLDDHEAEHIPGCNCAFLVEHLRAIGGFDPLFRIAGDDVDTCWRVQGSGGKIGFHPGAVVWHHRRNSIKAYWKQQRNYGRAEGLLERKWPSKYNLLGHITWGGRVYDRGSLSTKRLFARVYHGPWGLAPFQSMYDPAGGDLRSIPLMPEWLLLMAVCFAVGLFGTLWAPLYSFFAAALLGVGVTVARAVARGLDIAQAGRGQFASQPVRAFLIITGLHLMQPVARLLGRMQEGLTPWRPLEAANRDEITVRVPRSHTLHLWTDGWAEPFRILQILDHAFGPAFPSRRCGGSFDAWDMHVRTGLCGGATLKAGAEDLPEGRQLIRLRATPIPSTVALTVIGLLLTGVCFFLVTGGLGQALILALALVAVALRTSRECTSAVARLLAISPAALNATVVGGSAGRYFRPSTANPEGKGDIADNILGANTDSAKALLVTITSVLPSSGAEL